MNKCRRTAHQRCREGRTSNAGDATGAIRREDEFTRRHDEIVLQRRTRTIHHDTGIAWRVGPAGDLAINTCGTDKDQAFQRFGARPVNVICLDRALIARRLDEDRATNIRIGEYIRQHVRPVF